MTDAGPDGGFWLHDLRIETVLDGRTPVCRHVEGEAFRMQGETLIFDEGTLVSAYALAALLPLLPAKQRMTDPSDWMSTDAEVAATSKESRVHIDTTTPNPLKRTKGSVSAPASAGKKAFHAARNRIAVSNSTMK